jgi:hypothetical protein
MRIRKLMYDSFYSNNEAFSGVTAIENLGSDLYFHYIKNESGHYKLSGNTAATASGVIFEDSVTTSIVVTPTGYTNYRGLGDQISVVNQDGVNVISECTFVSANTGITVVDSDGAFGIDFTAITGTTRINVTHNDGPTGTTIVTCLPYTSIDATINGGNIVYTNFTGATTSMDVHFNSDTITAYTTLTSQNTAAVTVDSSGLVTLVGTGTTTITATIDGLSDSVTVTSYWPVTSVVVTPAAFTGTTTGQTQQLTVVDQNGRNIIAECTFVSYDTSIFTVDTTGLVTCVGNVGDGYVTATHTASGKYARPVTTWRFQP